MARCSAHVVTLAKSSGRYWAIEPITKAAACPIHPATRLPESHLDRMVVLPQQPCDNDQTGDRQHGKGNGQALRLVVSRKGSRIG